MENVNFFYFKKTLKFPDTPSHEDQPDIQNDSPKYCSGGKHETLKLNDRYIHNTTETQGQKIQKQTGNGTNIDVWWSDLLDLSCWFSVVQLRKSEKWFIGYKWDVESVTAAAARWSDDASSVIVI